MYRTDVKEYENVLWLVMQTLLHLDVLESYGFNLAIKKYFKGRKDTNFFLIRLGYVLDVIG